MNYAGMVVKNRHTGCLYLLTKGFCFANDTKQRYNSYVILSLYEKPGIMVWRGCHYEGKLKENYPPHKRYPVFRNKK